MAKTADPAAPVVRPRGFTRQFGANTILHALDLDIAPGEFVAPLGRSGSGKTALLLPWKRIWRNVALGLRGRNIRVRAEVALREVGFAHRLDAWPLTLSDSEAQRAALVREPALLLLDEPVAAPDALTRLKMHELVLSLWQAHHPAVLLVTHDVDEAIALSDRVLVLDQGRIVAEERIATPRGQRTASVRPLRAKLFGHLGVAASAGAYADVAADAAPRLVAAE